MYGFGYRYSPKGLYVPSGGGGALDPDAEAFLTAATITDPTEISAVNQLVIDMKDAGIWTKMIAVYPFVGGTATTHKWNLKDPQDLDAAFRLTFSGGWTHDSLGIKMNGTNTEAETFLTPNNGNDRAISAYLTQRISGAQGVILGAYNSGMLGIKASATQDLFHNNSGTTPKTITPTTINPFLGNSRTASNSWFTQNDNNVFTDYTDISPSVTRTLKIGNFNGTTWRGNHQLGFIHISTSLTKSEMTDLRSAVINFQTTLGRAV